MPNLDHAFAMITLELNVMQFVGKYGSHNNIWWFESFKLKTQIYFDILYIKYGSHNDVC